MPTIARLTVSWAGAPVVGPGVSVFHCATDQVAVVRNALHTFYAAINNYVPSGVQWVVDPVGDTIDEATGEVNGAWSDAALSVIGAIGSGTWANGVGARVRWLTAGFVGGRRVVGSTFIVPLTVNSYEGAGNITSATLGPLQTAASALAAVTPGVLIYSRKTISRPGSAYQVIGGAVPDKVSWLRSRRT